MSFVCLLCVCVGQMASVWFGWTKVSSQATGRRSCGHRKSWCPSRSHTAGRSSSSPPPLSPLLHHPSPPPPLSASPPPLPTSHPPLLSSLSCPFSCPPSSSSSSSFILFLLFSFFIFLVLSTSLFPSLSSSSLILHSFFPILPLRPPLLSPL